MNLLRIRYFVEAARYQNFSVAARNLFTSQPNLSKQIALMEQELGFQLFQRVGKSIYLTQAGEYLYEQFKELPDYCAQAIAQATALSRGDVGSLSVGILEGQDINRALNDRLDAIHSRYPELELQLERNSFRNLRQGLESCRYDLIITLSFELAGQTGWESRILQRQNGAVGVCRKNPISQRPDLTLADLAGEDFVAISPEESPGGYAHVAAKCQEAGFTPRIIRMASTLESMLLCVETGIGVCLLDSNTRLEHSDAVRMVPLPGNNDCDVVAAWMAENRNPMVRRIAAELSDG